jgi:hypothetical protein
MDVPTLSDSHRKLEKLTGKWSGEENLSGTGPGEAAREATSEITARLSLDGFFLILDYARSHDGHVSFLGHGVCGWEQSKEPTHKTHPTYSPDGQHIAFTVWTYAAHFWLLTPDAR